MLKMGGGNMEKKITITENGSSSRGATQNHIQCGTLVTQKYIHEFFGSIIPSQLRKMRQVRFCSSEKLRQIVYKKHPFWTKSSDFNETSILGLFFGFMRTSSKIGQVWIKYHFFRDHDTHVCYIIFTPLGCFLCYQRYCIIFGQWQQFEYDNNVLYQ